MPLIDAEKKFIMNMLNREYSDEIIAIVQIQKQKMKPINTMDDLLKYSLNIKSLYSEFLGLETIKDLRQKKTEIQQLIKSYVFTIIQGLKHWNVERLKAELSLDVKTYNEVRRTNPAFFAKKNIKTPQMSWSELKNYPEKVLKTAQTLENPLFNAIFQNKSKEEIGILLKSDDCLIYSEDADGNNVIHMACLAHRADLIEMFSKAGVHVDAVNKYKLTAMHFVSMVGGVDALDVLHSLGARHDIATDCVNMQEFFGELMSGKFAKK